MTSCDNLYSTSLDFSTSQLLNSLDFPTSHRILVTTPLPPNTRKGVETGHGNLAIPVAAPTRHSETPDTKTPDSRDTQSRENHGIWPVTPPFLRHSSRILPLVH